MWYGMCYRDASHFDAISQELLSHDTRTLIMFTCGLSIFFIALCSNIKSDAILRNLRKPGDNEYHIPKGFLFNYISCPNYFSEIVEWFGFALTTKFHQAAVLFWLVCLFRSLHPFFILFMFLFLLVDFLQSRSTSAAHP